MPKTSREAKQATLDGIYIPILPPVRTTDGHIVEWDRKRIIKQIIEETRLVETFYAEKGADQETAEDIARAVENRLLQLNLDSLSGPLIREIVNMTLLERGLVQYRNVCTRVGTPVYDAHLIDVGRGFESHDNANLQENAETSHKKKADKISKEQYLLQLPPGLADRHLFGDIHIHDLEYFGTRPFCLDGSTVIPFYEQDRVVALRPDQLAYHDDLHVPPGLRAFTPSGLRKVTKITRRKVEQGEMLKVRSSTGKSLLVTRDHRVPITRQGKRMVIPAGDVKQEDVLDGYAGGAFALRGYEVGSLDLVRELVASVPGDLLDNVYVRDLGGLLKDLEDRGLSHDDLASACGCCLERQWLSRGIMPVKTFARLCDTLQVSYYCGATVGVAGSGHDLPADLPITRELIRLLGFFVSEGNYNVSVTRSSYNLAITENHQSGAIMEWASSALNTYATRTGGSPDKTTIYGVPTERPRAMQVYFGGKLAWLLFRYVLRIPEGSKEKRLPWIVWHLGDDLLKEFLSALFTGDGSVCYRPEKSDCIVNYTTVSSSLRQELSLLLESLSIPAHIVELYSDVERTTLYRLQVTGYDSVSRFAQFARFLDERQDQVDRFLSEVHGINRKPHNEVVTAVEPAEPSGKFVYDIFLDGNGSEEQHCYLASDGLVVHNCQDWDLRYFLYYGLMPDGNGTKASVAGPAKRAEVAVLHAVKALGSAQTNFAGGQGYYNFLTFMAPFFEGMEYEGIKQHMQMFVYEMTQMMVARGGQLVFSSVQLSPGVPALWVDKPCVYKGKIWNGVDGPKRTYGEFEREVRLLFKALMEVMLEGDYWGKPFNFPKPEISIEPDFIHEREEFNREHPDLPTYEDLYLMTFELASKYGTPYYDNQLPEYRGAGEGISCYQCCAYQFSAVADKDSDFNRKLLFEDGKHFSMGSWQVVSVNCPRAAYKAEGDEERLFAELRSLMDVAVEVFRIKRRWMDLIRATGRMPFAMQRPKDPSTGERGAVAVDLEGLVYTIGVVGINEMVQHMTGHQLHEGQAAFRLAVKAMTAMELYGAELSRRHGMTIALARTPAETTGQRFVVSDLLNRRFRDAALAVAKGDLEGSLERLGTTRDLPIYYTNGTHVAPGANVSLSHRASIEHIFFPIIDGGNIFHIWLGEARPDPRGLMEMAFKLCRETQIGYFAFTRDLTISLREFKEYRPQREQKAMWMTPAVTRP